MTPRTPRTSTARAFNSLLCFASLALSGACAPGARGGDPFGVREITPPFLQSLEARDPALAADARGTIAVVWVTQAKDKADVWLAVSRDSGASFTTPLRLNQAEGQVRSFPEGSPVAALGPGGALAVAWSERRADASGAVDLRVRASADFGRTFGAAATVNEDAAGPPPELTWNQQRRWLRKHRADAFHGFPALAFLGDGSLVAAWLDDRNALGPEPARRSTLWSAFSNDGGLTWSPNQAVSDSACPCCRPALAHAPDDDVALAYRDGSNDLRDPRLALSTNGARSFATDALISRDGWRLPGCPDQGPALVWSGPQGGHYVWFTGADPPGVYVVRWRREGGAAGVRRPVGDGVANAMHPMVAAIDNAVLVGVESRATAASPRTLAVSALEPAGTWTPWTQLGTEATSGVLAAAGSRRAIACWVEHEGDRNRLRLAALTRRSGTRS